MTEGESILARLEHPGFAAEWGREVIGMQRGLPVYRMRREGGRPEARRMYVSAGIHGDEPAGPLALIELIEEGFDFFGIGVEMFPALNPDGLRAGARTNIYGVDLNRDYRGPRTAEVLAHISVIQRLPRIGVALSLHEDWEAEGSYIYQLNRSGGAGWAMDLLDAMAAHIPADPRCEIDGRRAEGGVIRPMVHPSDRSDWPEAIFLWEKVCSMSYTLETPSGLPLGRRCAALKAGVCRAAELLAAGQPA